MAEQRVERRLAAILAADVVGYSRLMGSNEVGTLRALKTLRKELIDPAISKHGGRVVKVTGDGILIEFTSVVDAVACAVEVQRAMAGRNVDTLPDRRVNYRIGVNIGDLIVDGEDLYGDGVNVAARLEALAEPGGVWISGAVHEHVRDKLPFAFADKGEQTVKNIARPVHVYALDADAVAALGSVSDATLPPVTRPPRHLRTLWLVAAILVLAVGIFWTAFRLAPVPEGPAPAAGLSIVVLPFANLSGDPTQDYLADVITDELITSLSRIRGSFVIARSTAFTYKGNPVDVKQIGRDLRVRYVLEGSQQQSGDRVRVNAQLISAETGAHLWADQFDTDRAELLTMQDEIVTRLARALDLEMGAVEAARVARTRPANQDAEDLALRCQAGMEGSTRDSPEQAAAYALCERAVQIDGRNVLALSIASVKYVRWVLDGLSTDPQTDIRQADEFAARALAIEPDNYWAHYAEADVLIVRKRLEEALIEARRSLTDNPSFIPAYNALCFANLLLGRPEKVIECADTAIRLSPRDPELGSAYTMKGGAYEMLKQDAQAVDWNRRAAAVMPMAPMAHWHLAAALALSGHGAESRDELKRFFSVSRIRTIAQLRAYDKSLALTDNPTYLAMQDRLIDGLRKAGMPEQ